jgi:hypothetical protein
VTSARRIQAAPELPTVAEAALPVFAPTDRRLSAVEFFRFCQSCYAAADARSRVDDLTGSMNALAGKHGSVLRRACMQGNDRLF